jgi:hypothetical protein
MPFLSKACEICGCGVGSNYLGILPEFKNKVFGLRYRYSSLFTHVGADGTTTYLTTKEKYATVEIWGGWTIADKIRIMGSIPYNFDERNNQGITNTKNGIGDIYTTAYYQLINKRHSTQHDKLLIQSLWIGGGIKLPTGKYNPSDKANTSENANLFQLGTGSTDFTLNTMYDIRLQDAGLSLSSACKINTTNKYEYKYGNKFSMNAQAYYKFRIKEHITIAPNAGVQYENSAADNDHEFDVPVSGGNLFLGTLGLETSFNRIAVGGNFQMPL